MSEREFRKWVAFFKLFPFDDMHRYHRPAAAVCASFGGGPDRYSKAIEFLAPEPVPEGMTLADWNTYKAFGVRPKIKED